MITISVRGLPIAQGSARAYVRGGRAILVSGSGTSTTLGAWRGSIATEARAVMGDGPAWTGPVSVRVWFSMPRPQAHYKAGVQRIGAPVYHVGKPDIDKLLRAVLDAITMVVLRDDAQVAQVRAWKVYERPDLPVGVTITVEPLAVLGLASGNER